MHFDFVTVDTIKMWCLTAFENGILRQRRILWRFVICWFNQNAFNKARIWWKCVVSCMYFYYGDNDAYITYGNSDYSDTSYVSGKRRRNEGTCLGTSVMFSSAAAHGLQEKCAQKWMNCNCCNPHAPLRAEYKRRVRVNEGKMNYNKNIKEKRRNKRNWREASPHA